MERDPFYLQIVERLNGHIDDEEFQACANDLLGKIFPGAIPYRGGDDAGMDGAIPDGEDEPFPIVITTSEYAIDNLTRNLKKYLSKGYKRRKAVFATPHPLTPRRIRNINRRAEELGFTMVGIYHQEWFARTLYRDPSWCLNLLGLTGKPSALSIIPLTTRPLLDQSLVGREADLEWLTTTRGNRLLIGQPGSGKTFLLYQFAQSGGGLFVVSDDLQEIANAIRRDQPLALIVDDAHMKVDLLIRLTQLKLEIGASYEIIASSWAAKEDQVALALQIGYSSIHHLEPLTRNEIVHVVQEAGVFGPDRLVREIVDQAEGRPGLAVTLVQVCLFSGPRELFLGEAVSRSVKTYFGPLLGQEIIAILATFSIGGDSGMPKKVVSKELGFGLADLWQIISQLAAGGILWDKELDCLSVFPIALRHALVRDVFFAGSGRSLDIVPLIEQAPVLRDAAFTLIGAQAYGAKVDTSLLLNLMIKLDDNLLWEEYAWLGEKETAWLLERYPNKVSALAHPGLILTPEKALPLLFGSAIGDNRPLNSATDHALRIIQDWIHTAEPGSDEAIERRKLLLDQIRKWLKNGGDQQVGLQALQNVFSPRYESTTTDPGLGMTVTIRFGCLTLDEIGKISSLWEQTVALLKSFEIKDWKLVYEILYDWIYPSRLNAKIPDDTYEVMRQFGSTMLQDLVCLTRDRPALLRQGRQIAKDANIQIEIMEDPEFEVLFPLENRESWNADAILQKEKAIELADRWSKCDPSQIALKIAAFEQEAHSAQVFWPRWTDFICNVLAEQVSFPILWAQAMIDSDVSGDLTVPFLRRAAIQNDLQWIDLAQYCLELPASSGAMVALILTLQSPPDDLVEKVLRKVSNFVHLVESLCIRGEVPVETLRHLLRHSDPRISSGAAHGEWYSDPRGSIRSELYNDWRSVVINKTPSDYWLSDVFSNDSDLAYCWLIAHLDDHDWDDDLDENKTVITAISTLSSRNKQTILEKIRPDRHYIDLVRLLVDSDLDLYQMLLDNQTLKPLHLGPLVGQPNNPAWVAKAKLALDKDYSPEQIASSVYGIGSYSISWWGPESNIWEEWVIRFDYLCQEADNRVKRIGVIGKEHTLERKKRALARERHEEVYGIHDSRRSPKYH